jgi:hypothetical protein
MHGADYATVIVRIVYSRLPLMRIQVVRGYEM